MKGTEELNKTLTHEIVKKKTAIVILAFAEYESLELSLATHAKFSVDAGVPIFILQNGRGTYDTERTLSVGRRYQSLFPESIKVVEHIPPNEPYLSIQQLFNDELLADYEYIIKLDDDVMVLTPDWIDKLIDSYVSAYNRCGDELAYVTALVNNNPYGFKKLLEVNEALSQEYFTKLARPHMIGLSPKDSDNPSRLVSKETVYGGGFGTIWQLPYVSRWLHEKTTLQPEYYINSVKGLDIAEFDPKDRYSINCIFFNKNLWEDMSDGRADDEGMLHAYCMQNKKKIYVDLSVPMVHLAFYSQREEMRDIFARIRDVYTTFLSLPFSIAMCSDRLIEIESRLRFLASSEEQKKREIENRLSFLASSEEQKKRADRLQYDLDCVHNSVSFRVGRAITCFPRKVRGGVRCLRDHGAGYTVRRTLYHMGLWEDEETPRGSENRPKLVKHAERILHPKKGK